MQCATSDPFEDVEITRTNPAAGIYETAFDTGYNSSAILSSTKTHYDANGRVDWTESETGLVTHFEYDDARRQERTWFELDLDGDSVDVLRDLFMIRGVPRHIRSDNGPEFVAHAIRRFLTTAGVETLYIEPGSPWQNGYAESFHSRVRDEFMAGELFADLEEARVLADRWKNDYNHRRPYSSLVTPATFAASLRPPPVGAAPLPPADAAMPSPWLS